MEECITCKHFQKRYFGRHVVCHQCDDYSRYEPDPRMMKKILEEEKEYVREGEILD